jgi:hypothetical protein
MDAKILLPNNAIPCYHQGFLPPPFKTNSHEIRISLFHRFYAGACGLLQCCSDLKFLSAQAYETVVAQLPSVREQVEV